MLAPRRVRRSEHGEAASSVIERRDSMWFEGNYGSYVEDLKKRKGPEADQPHRIGYKKLVRA